MPTRLALNCDATQLAVLDASGALSFYDPVTRCHQPVTREVAPHATTATFVTRLHDKACMC